MYAEICFLQIGTAPTTELGLSTFGFVYVVVPPINWLSVLGGRRIGWDCWSSGKPESGKNQRFYDPISHTRDGEEKAKQAEV